MRSFCLFYTKDGILILAGGCMQEKIKVIGIFLVAILCSIVIGMEPQLVLNGKSKIQIAVGTSYHEKGAHMKVPFSSDHYPVSITGTVDTTKLGDYTITYQSKIQNKMYQKKRKVEVLDFEPPVIVLKGDKEVHLCVNEKVQEAGYEAMDDYDGDLTNQVRVRELKDKIIYQVEDSSHNSVTTTRSLIREDKEAPKITITGGTTTTMYVGESYQELGYQAYDACDGNLTNQVKITGTVDTQKKGVYELVYSVEDSNHNLSKATRTVQVLPKLSTTDKVIYLTFDDGPSRTITPQILKILKEENVKATFFVINHDASLDYLILQEHQEGHTVAIHSYTHNYRQIYASETSYFNDLSMMSNKIEKITGEKPNLIRFPGGSSNTVSRFNPGIMSRLTQEVMKRGYFYYDWNVPSGDAGEVKSSTQVYQNVIRNLNSKTNVVLMHDFENNYYTLDALRNIIQYGKRMGYTFAPITENTPPIHHKVNN